MKRPRSKLGLQHETIRVLADRQLTLVAGGQGTNGGVSSIVQHCVDTSLNDSPRR